MSALSLIMAFTLPFVVASKRDTLPPPTPPSIVAQIGTQILVPETVNITTNTVYDTVYRETQNVGATYVYKYRIEPPTNLLFRSLVYYGEAVLGESGDIAYVAPETGLLVCSFQDAYGRIFGASYQVNLIPKQQTISAYEVVDILNKRYLVYQSETNILSLLQAGKTTRGWSKRPGWLSGDTTGTLTSEYYRTNSEAAVITWDTNFYALGAANVSGVSPFNTIGLHQVQCTLLTKRHAYCRGHSLGNEVTPGEIRHDLDGHKVFFADKDNNVAVMTVAARLGYHGLSQRDGNYYDYTLLMFTEDVPEGIEPVSVLEGVDYGPYYLNFWMSPLRPRVGYQLLHHIEAEQGGYFFVTGKSGFTGNSWKPGDSGSPNLIIVPLEDGTGYEFVMTGGRTTSPASLHMQTDIDNMCVLVGGVSPSNYQMKWLDVTNRFELIP